MFNTFLDIKRKYLIILFWWAFVVLNLIVGTDLWKYMHLPPAVIETQTKIVTQNVYVGKYETKPIYDLQGVSNLDLVKFGNQTMCVSSINYDRVANYQMGQQNPAAVINLREKGDC